MINVDVYDVCEVFVFHCFTVVVCGNMFGLVGCGIAVNTSFMNWNDVFDMEFRDNGFKDI